MGDNTAKIPQHKIFKKRENACDFWNFMHTLAAYYPDHPSTKEKKHMRFFVESCADYFLIELKWAKRYNKNVEVFPPKVESRDAFMIWMCEQHNLINESIGKPIYPCTLPNLIKRWGPVTLPDDKKSNTTL